MKYEDLVRTEQFRHERRSKIADLQRDDDDDANVDGDNDDDDIYIYIYIYIYLSLAEE